LTALTLGDASAFVKAHYRPEAMTMVVAGDLDRANAQKLIREVLPPELYGDDGHPRSVAPQPAPPAGEPPVAAPGPILRAHAAVASPELWIAWSTPGGFQADRNIAELWATLANSNFSRARLDDTDVSSVDFFVTPSSLVSMLICRVRLADGKHPEESLRQVVNALPWIGDDEIYLEYRFEGLKLGAIRRIMLGTESAENRSQDLAEYLHFTGNLNAFQGQVDTVSSVHAPSARAFAQRYLGRERARAVLIEPIDGAGAPPEPVPLAKQFAEDASYPPMPSVTLDSLAKVRRLAGLRTVTLKNGLQVIILRRPAAGVITASLGFHGGEAAAGPGVASTAFDNIDLNWEASPSSFGIGFSFGVGREMSTMAMYAGARNVPRALDMLSFLVRSYDLEWPSEKFKTVKLPLLRREEATASSRGQRAFFEALYHGHRYGDNPTPDQIAAIKRVELASWLDQTVGPANAALAVVGDIDPVEAEAAVRDAFEGWSAPAALITAPPPARPRAPAPAPADPPPAPWAAVITHRPGATQSELRIGCLLPPGDARSKAVYEITADLIDSTLEKRLRQQVGATYGVRVAARVMRGGTALLQIDSAIDNARLPEAMSAVARFWKRSATDPVDADHFRHLRDWRAVHRALGAETSVTLARILLDSWNHGWPLDWLDKAPADVVSVQATEVEATLRSCAQNLVLSLTGDEQVIRAALASVGR
jgi:zinc protease